MATATFNPNAYDVRDLAHAKMLTVGDLGTTDKNIFTASEERWVDETPYTVDLVAEHFEPIKHRTFILDYGCGTGRISKGLIDRYDCEIVGCDMSESMRGVARQYVGHPDRFHTCSPDRLKALRNRFDYAMCLWVLQHSATPKEDAVRMLLTLKPGGKLFVLNELQRMVPTMEAGFVNDRVDIRECLARVFGHPLVIGQLDASHVNLSFAARTWWAVYQREAS
jgi:SAM-dependent methyltransferase